MFNRLKAWCVHREAIHVMNRALTMYSGIDWNANYVTARIVKLCKFDITHHCALPMDWDKAGKLVCLAKSPGEPAIRTAEMILREYVKIFEHSYQIDMYKDTELTPLAYHYLTNLDINLLPVSEDEKFRLTLMNELL